MNEVPIKAIVGSKYARLITYPLVDEAKTQERVSELQAIGVTSLRFTGDSLIAGIRVLGKGCVGLVTEAVLDGVPVALKIRRLDANRPTMENEGKMLRLANSVDAGPRLVGATRNFLIMELFDGIPLVKWVESSHDGKDVREILSQLLHTCYRLDSIGLDHGELSHAPKNVLVNRKGAPCIVDFETASTTRRTANLTSILQYFLFGRVSKAVHASKLFPGRRAILNTLSVYKADQSVENFRNVLSALKMAG